MTINSSNDDNASLSTLYIVDKATCLTIDTMITMITVTVEKTTHYSIINSIYLVRLQSATTIIFTTTMGAQLRVTVGACSTLLL